MTIGAKCVARPLAAQAPGGLWGIEGRSTGRLIAYGSEGECRTLAARAAAADASRVRAEVTATGAHG